MGLQPGHRVPTAGDQHDNGKFGAQGDHPALPNAAASATDCLAQVADDTGVGADGGDRQ
ncbi:MAG: hypothetical protein R3F24_09995 [Gammaproteobacteria bacterium]